MTDTGETIKAVKENAGRIGLTWNLSFGTCVSGTVPSATTVTFDGDSSSISTPTVSLIGTVTAGTRVAILSIPGGGQFIIGFL